jgi:hypothetical protein
MTRKTVTSEELVSLMTQELQRRLGHQNCSLGPPKIYRKPDEGGCTWSPNVVLHRSGLPSPECELEAVEVIHWARQRYKVEPRT